MTSISSWRIWGKSSNVVTQKTFWRFCCSKMLLSSTGSAPETPTAMTRIPETHRSLNGSKNVSDQSFQTLHHNLPVNNLCWDQVTPVAMRELTWSNMCELQQTKTLKLGTERRMKERRKDEGVKKANSKCRHHIMYQPQLSGNHWRTKASGKCKRATLTQSMGYSGWWQHIILGSPISHEDQDMREIWSHPSGGLKYLLQHVG